MTAPRIDRLGAAGTEDGPPVTLDWCGSCRQPTSNPGDLIPRQIADGRYIQCTCGRAHVQTLYICEPCSQMAIAGNLPGLTAAVQVPVVEGRSTRPERRRLARFLIEEYAGADPEAYRADVMLEPMPVTAGPVGEEF